MSTTSRYCLAFWFVLFIGLIMVSAITLIALPQGRVGVVAELTSTIDGGAVEVVSRAVSEAVGRSSVLILYIDSYGGYLTATDSIIKIVMESGVVTYVYIPPGGKAASAGSLIALLGRKIFMGEASTIGAAQPSPSDEKTINYVVGRFRSLATIAFKGNETLVRIAEEFVTKNRVLSAAEAVVLGFAEPANSLEEVRQKLGLDELVVVGYTAWNHLISVFSVPIVSSIALIVGIALIFIEFVQAGFQGYAIAGIVLILLSLYSMWVVPVSLFALSLLIMGLILLLIEILTPGFGAFGITGLILMFVGAYETITRESFGIPSILPLVVAAGFAMLGGLMIYVGYEAGKVRRLKTKTLREKLIGEVGISKTRLTRETPGVVHVLGEDWTAYSVDEVIEPGTKVKVTDVKGLTLYVSKIGEFTNESGRSRLQES
ncbi:MAG: NfeD family protein [Desulfurococcaceae archaeon TW002]